MHGAPGIPCPRRSPTAQLSTLRTHSPSQAPVPTPVAPVGREGGLPRLSGRWMTAGRHAPLLLLGSGSCVQSCHLPPSNKVTSCSPPHPCQAASPLHPSILLCGFPSPFLPTEVLTHPNLQIPLLPLMWETLGGSSRGRGAADSRAGDRCLLGVSHAGPARAGSRCTGPSLAASRAGSRASSVHRIPPRPQTSTEPGCLRCCCRSWMLCSSFFW